jgi:hypothetical protein
VSDVEKYVSLWQPWATLWVAGAPIGKGNETRSWATRHRGPLAVHAAKRVDIDSFFLEPFRSALRELGYEQPLDLPRGAVIGVVEITDCLRMVSADFCGHQKADDEICLLCDPRLTERERAFGIYEPDRFAWIAGPGRRALEAPIPMKALQRIQRLAPDIAGRVAAGPYRKERRP